MTAASAFAFLSGLVASGSVLIAATLVVRLHLAPTGVDPVREGVSAYALTVRANLYHAQAIASGIAAALLVVGLWALGLGSIVGLGVLLIYAATRIVIVRYPTDPPGTSTLTATGRAHAALAAASFVSLAVAAPVTGLALAETSAWDRAAQLLVAVSIAVPVSVMATFGSGGWPRLRPYFGLVERMIYATGFAWLLIVGIGLAAVSVA